MRALLLVSTLLALVALPATVSATDCDDTPAGCFVRCVAQHEPSCGAPQVILERRACDAGPVTYASYDIILQVGEVRQDLLDLGCPL
jgi:hypothetical protein